MYFGRVSILHARCNHLFWGSGGGGSRWYVGTGERNRNRMRRWESRVGLVDGLGAGDGGFGVVDSVWCISGASIKLQEWSVLHCGFCDRYVRCYLAVGGLISMCFGARQQGYKSH